jgi:hypothetical protein
MTFGPSGNLRGFLRGLPSMLFRTQARRVMFMLASAVLLCLVIPSTLAIVRESLPAFIASVCSLTVGLALPGGIRLVTRTILAVLEHTGCHQPVFWLSLQGVRLICQQPCFDAQ